MTSTYSNNNTTNDADMGVTVSEGVSTASTPLPPKYFKYGATPLNYEIVNNEYTSGPYYYDYERNSWIFYIPGTDIPNPPLDPVAGNLWIDPTNMYLMYVYNENEMTFPEAVPEQWYALTTNKRAYDYLILPVSTNGDNVGTRVGPSDIDIFNQAYMYFNTADADIKVKVGSEPGGVLNGWASITQRSLDAVVDPDLDWNHNLPASALRQLQTSVDELEVKVEALKIAAGVADADTLA